MSEWVKSIRSLVKDKIHVLTKCNTKYKPILYDPSVRECLNNIHERFVVVPADKAPNNIIFICKAYYLQCLMDELNLSASNSTNTTYKRVPSLYWIPKLHTYPNKQRFIAGSSKCSTKKLSILLTAILTKIKDRIYSRSGVNQMWILKNFKYLLENINNSSNTNNISLKTYDFSTLYTTMPH